MSASAPSFLMNHRARAREGGWLLRSRGEVLRLMPFSDKQVELAARAPRLLEPAVGTLSTVEGQFLLQAHGRGVRLDRDPRRATRHPALALAVWRMFCAGSAPGDIDLQDYLAHADGLTLLRLPPPGGEKSASQALIFAASTMLNRRATLSGSSAGLLRVVARALGGESSAPLLMRSALHSLPNTESVSAFLHDVVDVAKATSVPQAIALTDADQAEALRWLLVADCARRGLRGGDSRLPGSGDGVRIFGPLSATDCAKRLENLSAQPSVAIVLASERDAERELAALANLCALPLSKPAEVLAWLKPLGLAAEDVVETLAPHLSKPPSQARRMVLALIERAGAEVTPDGLALKGDWRSAWRELTRPRMGPAVAHPAAARLAGLLSLSRRGLNAAEVDASKELSRGLSVLEGIGLADRDGAVVRATAGSAVASGSLATRRAEMLWLAARPHLAPEADALKREAWSLSLRLRAGELADWAESGEALVRRMMDARELALVLELYEAHALAASQRGAGPPSLDALLDAAELGNALSPAQRRRRLLRLWLRRYTGELKPVLLAVLARTERTLRGVTAYQPMLDEALAQVDRLPRLLREQTLIEAAASMHQDDSDAADELLKRLPPNPARDAHYLSRARATYMKAHSRFVRLNPQDAMSILQDALAQIGPRAPWFRRVRVEAQIESLNAMAWAQVTLSRRDFAPVIERLLGLQREYGCCEDHVCTAVVNDFLFRARMREPGTVGAGELEQVLAHAPPHNRRGYVVVLHQLSENSVYSGNLVQSRQIDARMESVAAPEVAPGVAVSWARHMALARALAGDWPGMKRAWRRGRLRVMSEPWRSRSLSVKLGEWGVILLLAGRPKVAAQKLRQSAEMLRAIGATTRGSTFVALALVADLLQGKDPDASGLQQLRVLAGPRHALPSAVLAMLEALATGSGLARLRDDIDDMEAPPLWKGAVLAVAAVVARHRGMREAALLADAARRHLPPDIAVLRRWLDSELPQQVAPPTPHQPRVLSGLAGLAVPLHGAVAVSVLCETVAGAIMVAVDAEAAAIRVSGGAASRGTVDAVLAAARDQAMLGGEIVDGDIVAVPLEANVGCVAVRLVHRDDAAPAAVRAFARRLDELLVTGAARNDREVSAGMRKALARAAWTLASTAHSPMQRLQALADLARAEAGSQACEMALLRRMTPVWNTSRIHDWDFEATRRVDHTLSLRLRASGGMRDTLDAAADNAADAVTAMLAEHAGRLRSELGSPEPGEPLEGAGEPLGDSAASRRLYDDLRRYADLELPVVITGEQGAGKDLAARALHAMSQRAARPLMVLDCATLRPETAASELFGHVVGAFTGATADHTGLLEAAGEGCLQIDGIAELVPQIQSMLLRVLQSRRFLPVGGTHEREFRARMVVTSTEPLDVLVARGTLRQDLAQRLAGLPLRVPPLRERANDAVLIARHVVRQFGTQLGRALRLSSRAEQAILGQAWPGNVRELKAALTRAAIMSVGNVIEPVDLEQSHSAADAVSIADDDNLNLTQKLALGMLRKQGELTPRTLMQRLGVSRTTASQALSALAAQGNARREGKGRASRYVPAE